MTQTPLCLRSKIFLVAQSYSQQKNPMILSGSFSAKSARRSTQRQSQSSSLRSANMKYANHVLCSDFRLNSTQKYAALAAQSYSSTQSSSFFSQRKTSEKRKKSTLAKFLEAKLQSANAETCRLSSQVESSEWVKRPFKLQWT